MKKTSLFLASLLSLSLLAGCGSEPAPVETEPEDVVLYPVSLRIYNKTETKISEIYAVSEETGETQLLYDTSMDDFMLLEEDLISCDYIPASETDYSFRFDVVMENGETFGGEEELEAYVVDAWEYVVLVAADYFDPEDCLFNGPDAMERYLDIYEDFTQETEEEPTTEADLYGTGDFSSYEALGLTPESEQLLRNYLHDLRFFEYERPDTPDEEEFGASVIGYWFPAEDGYEALQYYQIERSGVVYHMAWNGTEDVKEKIGVFDGYDRKTSSYHTPEGFTLKVGNTGILGFTTGEFTDDPILYHQY